MRGGMGVRRGVDGEVGRGGGEGLWGSAAGGLGVHLTIILTLSRLRGMGMGEYVC